MMNYDNERIIEAMDSLDIEQTDLLLDEEIEIQIGKRKRDWIKRSVLGKVNGEQVAPIRRWQPTRQFMGVASAALLLAVGTFAMFHFLKPVEPVSVIQPQSEDWVWIVEPVLELNELNLCGECDVFIAFDEREFVVCEETGEYIGQHKNIHVGGNYTYRNGRAHELGNLSTLVWTPDESEHNMAVAFIDIDTWTHEDNWDDTVLAGWFSDVLLISEQTAFAKLDGLWGIIGFNGYEAEVTEPSEPTEPTAPTEVVAVARGDWTWVVKPTFEYGIVYCFVCNAFATGGEGGVLYDEVTGSLRMATKGGHTGYRGDIWFYDESLDLLGRAPTSIAGAFELYPRGEFNERFPHAGQRVKVVRHIDSALIETDEMGNEYLPHEEWLRSANNVAVAYDAEFITDFVYTEVNAGRRTASRELAVVADSDGNVGAIGSDGDVWVPFEFESILVIDAWTAFAKKDGLWGIIAFNGSVPVDRPNPNSLNTGADIISKTAQFGKFSGLIGISSWDDTPTDTGFRWQIAEIAINHLAEDKSVVSISRAVVYHAYEPTDENNGFASVYLMATCDDSVTRVFHLNLMKFTPESEWRIWVQSDGFPGLDMPWEDDLPSLLSEQALQIENMSDEEFLSAYLNDKLPSVDIYVPDNFNVELKNVHDYDYFFFGEYWYVVHLISAKSRREAEKIVDTLGDNWRASKVESREIEYIGENENYYVFRLTINSSCLEERIPFAPSVYRVIILKESTLTYDSSERMVFNAHDPKTIRDMTDLMHTLFWMQDRYQKNIYRSLYETETEYVYVTYEYIRYDKTSEHDESSWSPHLELRRFHYAFNKESGVLSFANVIVLFDVEIPQ